MIFKNKKVGVLCGGASGEREVSLISGREVASALKRQGFYVEEIDVHTNHYDAVKNLILENNIGIAFIALHGEFGEDGQIQTILEELDIPYTGSEPESSRLSMDKIASKNIFIRNNIPTPPFFVIENEYFIPTQKNPELKAQDECVARVPSSQRVRTRKSRGVARRGSIPALDNIDLPKVIKPYYSGSSLGVSIVSEEKDLYDSLYKAFSVNAKVIIEEYIKGRELTVGILEDRPLSVVEIVPKGEYFDFTTKYSDGLAEFKVPAALGDDTYNRVMDMALKAHISLGCRHFSRADIRLGEDGTPYVLEINSIPGLTSHSLLPLSAKACNIDFDELIVKMIEPVFKNEKKEKQKIQH